MAVKDGLLGTFAVVASDIKARDRFIRCQAIIFSPVEQLTEGIDFRLSQLKISRDVSFRDNQYMKVSYRKTIENEVPELVFRQNFHPVDFTK